jgi:hypothetical protein
VSLANTLIGPTMLLPALGGALVDWINAPTLFALCGAAGWVGFSAAVGLPRSRMGEAGTRIDQRAAVELVAGDEP